MSYENDNNSKIRRMSPKEKYKLLEEYKAFYDWLISQDHAKGTAEQYVCALENDTYSHHSVARKKYMIFLKKRRLENQAADEEDSSTKAVKQDELTEEEADLEEEIKLRDMIDSILNLNLPFYKRRKMLQLLLEAQ